MCGQCIICSHCPAWVVIIPQELLSSVFLTLKRKIFLFLSEIYNAVYSSFFSYTICWNLSQKNLAIVYSRLLPDAKITSLEGDFTILHWISSMKRFTFTWNGPLCFQVLLSELCFWVSLLAPKIWVLWITMT